MQDLCLEDWSPSRGWEGWLGDAYAPGLTNNIQYQCWSKGYQSFTHGGGASMVGQTNDTELHKPLRSGFCELQQEPVLEKDADRGRRPEGVTIRWEHVHAMGPEPFGTVGFRDEEEQRMFTQYHSCSLRIERTEACSDCGLDTMSLHFGEERSLKSRTHIRGRLITFCQRPPGQPSIDINADRCWRTEKQVRRQRLGVSGPRTVHSPLSRC